MKMKSLINALRWYNGNEKRSNYIMMLEVIKMKKHHAEKMEMITREYHNYLEEKEDIKRQRLERSYTDLLLRVSC